MALIKREDIQRYILTNLGWPAVACELDPAQIGEAIDTAIDEYLSTGQAEKAIYPLNVVAGINIYELPPEVGTVSNILYSQPFNLMSGTVQDMFNMASFNAPFGVGGQNMFHGAANLGMFYEYIQNRTRVIGNEITFRQMDNKLHLWPVPKESCIGILEYSKNAFGITDRDNDAISLSNQWGIYWLKRMSLAISKNMLGMIRGKYSTVAGSTSESQQLNGNELIAQSKEEMAALREELISHNTHTQFYIA